MLLAAASFAQNLTTVTASKIQDDTGALLAAGSLCFQATDNRDVVISYQVGGGGQAVTNRVCTAVTNGAIGSFTVANPASTTPSGIYYRVTVTSSAAGAGTTILLYRLVTFSGATFNFDNYIPTGVGIPPSAADTVLLKSPAGSQTWTQAAGTTGRFAGAGTFDFSAATLNLPIAKITPPSPCTTNYFIRWTGTTYDCAAGGSSGSTPGGATNHVQYNNAGALGGDANFAFYPTALATPGAPTVTNVGTAGATTRRYAIVARNAVGGTVLGANGTTTTSNATLTGSNYNHLAWTAVTGAATYDVWLTTAGGNTPTTGFLANVATNSYDHQGTDGDGGDITGNPAETQGIYSGYALTIGPSPWTQPKTIIASWAQAARSNITLITSNPYESALNVNSSNTAAGATGAAMTVSAYANGSGVNISGITSNAYYDGASATAINASAYSGFSVVLSGNVSPYVSGYTIQMDNEGSGTIANSWGFLAQPPANSGGGTVTSNVAFYATDQCGVAGITNSYFLWHDSRGVYRIKCDNTFDGVYQSIPALYNPQFTKYAPGAADYERIVEQWNGNVAELGAEKGGTGTLRKLRMIGASFDLKMNNRTAAFDLSNIANAATRTVNIPDATSTTVQPDTGSANNFLTAISAQGVISKARPACADLSNAAASCATDATNATNISSGTLNAGRLPTSVPTSIVNDTNVTGAIASNVLTLGWTGTLAAGRLNSNVVQSVVNDTNVTGAIASQVLTLNWTGTLAKARQHAQTAYYDDAAPAFTNLVAFPGGIKVGAGIANDTVTGTTNNRLAKMASGKLLVAGTSDTNVPVWIVTSGAGTAGNAYIALAGQADVDFDGATTVDDYVVASTTAAGKAHDAGATRPAGVFVLGQVTSTNGAAGQYTVTLSHAPGYNFNQLAGSLACAQHPALTGNVTTSAGNCATTIAASAVTNAMLAGSIAASKLVGSDIATVGTIGTGVWQGTKIGLAYGGTNADLSATGGTNNVLKQASAGAAITVGTINCAFLSDAAASCATDATNASNIGSGTLPAARLPNPSSSTLGGVQSKAAVSNQFLTSISTSGVPASAQPACADLSNSGNGCSNATQAANSLLAGPSSGSAAAPTFRALANADLPVATVASGTTHTLVAPREYWLCTGTCTVTPPVPAAGYEFCVRNSNNVATVITLAALGSSAMYEKQDRTGYGTAGTGTLVMGGTKTDQVCLVGLDSTHYLLMSVTGTATTN